MTRPLRFGSPVEGCSLRPLTEADLPALQALLQRCADYVLLVNGRPPSPTAARKLWTVLPEGWSTDDKHTFGLFSDGLRGVADVISGWPEQGTWLIGLLLLDPSVRGRGIGAAIVAALDDWAARSGAARLRVSVAESNPRALRFWSSLGFASVPTLGASAIALERPVGARSPASS